MKRAFTCTYIIPFTEAATAMVEPEPGTDVGGMVW